MPPLTHSRLAFPWVPAWLAAVSGAPAAGPSAACPHRETSPSWRGPAPPPPAPGCIPRGSRAQYPRCPPVSQTGWRFYHRGQGTGQSTRRRCASRPLSVLTRPQAAMYHRLSFWFTLFHSATLRIFPYPTGVSSWGVPLSSSSKRLGPVNQGLFPHLGVFQLPRAQRVRSWFSDRPMPPPCSGRPSWGWWPLG